MISVTPSFSLTPNKLVLFNRFDHLSSTGTIEKKPVGPVTTKKVVRSFHNFELSPNAYRSLRQKITWLYHASKKRDIKTYSGRHIFSFRCAFITFTLPSSQKTPTIDVTSRLFNNCLTVLRQRFGMQNYVWRLEFQGNGNVHYHLATDSYIDYFAVQKVWNQILELDGYISDYRQKHEKMTLKDYVTQYGKQGTVPFQVLAKRYAKGKATNWSNPNSVDVKSIVSKNAIAAYISKYFGKSSKKAKKCNPLDNEDNSSSLRLWFCSRGLSRLKTISDYLPHVSFSPESLVRECRGFKRIVYQYAVVYYFELKTSIGWSRRFLESVFSGYLKEMGYCPVT